MVDLPRSLKRKTPELTVTSDIQYAEYIDYDYLMNLR